MRHCEKLVPAPPKHPPPQKLMERQRAKASTMVEKPPRWWQPTSAMVEKPVPPYLPRTDVGNLGIVNGSYNGCTEEEASVDLTKCPGSVMLLQRVPNGMLDTLRLGPRDSGADKRDNLRWMWVVGSDDLQVHRLAIAARAEAVEKMTKLSCKSAPRRRINRDPASFMIVDLQLTLTMHGFKNLAMATVDLPEEPTEEEWELFLTEFAREAIEHNVRVVGGHFGKALWMFQPEMEARDIRCDMVAWTPWIDKTGAMRVLSDTTGCFVLGGCSRSRMLFAPQALTSSIEDLSKPQMRHYGCPEYYGGDEVCGLQLGQFMGCRNESQALKVFELRGNARKTQDWQVLPTVTQKKWGEEAVGEARFRAGVHIPLMFFIGDRSRRTEESLQRRAKWRAEKKRAKKQGKGCIRDCGSTGGLDCGSAGKGKGGKKDEWSGGAEQARKRKSEEWPRNPWKLKKIQDAAKDEGEGRANPFKTDKDADEDGGCGRGRKGRADEQEESEEEPSTESDEICEPNWGSGSNGGHASPGDLRGTTRDAADKGDPKRRGPSAMAEAIKHASWKAYVSGPNDVDGRWHCPACSTSFDEERRLKRHVWSLAGRIGHPSAEEQDLWYETITPGKKPK